MLNLSARLKISLTVDSSLKFFVIFLCLVSEYSLITNLLTRRVYTLETDFRGHQRINFWYLKMKPSVPNFISQTLFLEIQGISSQISSILLKNDASSIDCHMQVYSRYKNEEEKLQKQTVKASLSSNSLKYIDFSGNYKQSKIT